MSKRMASKLLEHFYESPESALLAGVIRRCRLLDLRTPRKTEPLLLLSILCRTWIGMCFCSPLIIVRSLVLHARPVPWLCASGPELGQVYRS